MGLFESIMNKEPASPQEVMSEMNKELARMREDNELVRRFGAGLNDAQMDFYREVLADERRQAAHAIERKKFEESERIRVEEENKAYFDKLYTSKELVLYVDGKKTPFQRGMGIRCPHCNHDAAFPSFSEHLKPHLIQKRNENAARGLINYGLLMCRAPDMPFTCNNPECHKSVHITLLFVPEGK